MRTVMPPSFALLRACHLTPDEEHRPLCVEPLPRLDQRAKLMIRFHVHLKFAAVIVWNPDDIHPGSFRRGDPGWSVFKHKYTGWSHLQARRGQEEEIRLRLAALDFIASCFCVEKPGQTCGRN